MQGVVLHGTGTRAVLEGYTSAGKTGTAQKVDPATHAYSHTKYVASFAGFAPINNPAITVAVVLDSAVGLHQGGQVCAPVFHRIAQQVLEYLHVAHDVELPNRQLLLAAARRVKEQDFEEGSPDHPGENIDVAEAFLPRVPTPPVDSSSTPTGVVPAALRQTEAIPAPVPEQNQSQAAVTNSQPVSPASAEHPVSGTVVLDVDQGGTVVPSFAGKSLRGAIEMAEENGLDLDPIGSGVAREQDPVPGSRVTSGSRVTVKFGR
jgi:cell division protein FtsI (penicillin-binding protein 3)